MTPRDDRWLPDSPATETLSLVSTATGGVAECLLSAEILDGPARGATLPTVSHRVVVGGGQGHPESEWTIDDPGISRKHAELRAVAGGILVTDLQSKNGTWIGGVRVTEVLLPTGGVVAIGSSLLRITIIEREVQAAASETVGVFSFGSFVTTHRPLGLRLALLERASRSDSTVLIEGPTGTGKEILARSIHECSARSAGPYVVVDCGAISSALMESELFGHVKGAFTGASESRVGALAAARGGTVFLDEIGELPLDLQPKLLRALESRTIRSVGTSREQEIDVRFVAATNRSLKDMVSLSRFRSDLYYRLAVVEARIPPLSERIEDVPLLARRFVDQLGRGRSRIGPEALAMLTQYDWPGNVRELRNVVERALAIAPTDELRPEDILPEHEVSSGGFHAAKEAVIASFERRYVQALLERHDGNVSKAAKAAGLSRNALYELAKRGGVSTRKE